MSLNFRGYYDEIIFDANKNNPGFFAGKKGDTKSRGLYVTIAQNSVSM